MNQSRPIHGIWRKRRPKAKAISTSKNAKSVFHAMIAASINSSKRRKGYAYSVKARPMTFIHQASVLNTARLSNLSVVGTLAMRYSASLFKNGSP